MTRHLFPVLALALAALALAGCPAQKPPPPQVPSAPPPVRLRAYINVTSGCQKPTVDFMRSLAQKYPRLQLELVDFGDGGEGADRWKQSGNTCMTLEINGLSMVKFMDQGKMKAVAFHMPVGLQWTHEDLEHAVQAALAGRLQPATEEETEGDASAEPTTTKPPAHKPAPDKAEKSKPHQ